MIDHNAIQSLDYVVTTHHTLPICFCISAILLIYRIGQSSTFKLEKYRAKYGQIDRLCQHSWSLEGLRREMWGVSIIITDVVFVFVLLFLMCIWNSKIPSSLTHYRIHSTEPGRGQNRQPCDVARPSSSLHCGRGAQRGAPRTVQTRAYGGFARR